MQVFSWIGEMPPDPRRPLDTYYDARMDRFAVYDSEVNISIYVFIYMFLAKNVHKKLLGLLVGLLVNCDFLKTLGLKC